MDEWLIIIKRVSEGAQSDNMKSENETEGNNMKKALIKLLKSILRKIAIETLKVYCTTSRIYWFCIKNIK